MKKNSIPQYITDIIKFKHFPSGKDTDVYSYVNPNFAVVIEFAIFLWIVIYIKDSEPLFHKSFESLRDWLNSNIDLIP